MEDTHLREATTGFNQDGLMSPCHPGLKFGVHCRTMIQVAIKEGNKRQDAFFMVRVGKSGVALPYQQPIPMEFARYHPKLQNQSITLEAPCGRLWEVDIGRMLSVLRFGKGWRNFSVENNLREGYQLLFTLVGESRFAVQFFDNVGQRHTSYSPLTPRASPAFAEPSFATQPSPPVVLGPKPDSFRGKPGALNSEKAKVILRQFFMQPGMPKSKLTIPNEDARELEKTESLVGKQVTYEEQGKVEGKAFLNLDSDEEDEPLQYLRESPEQQDLPEAAFSRKVGKRGFYEDNNRVSPRVSKHHEFYSGEQIGSHSSKKVNRGPSKDANNSHLTPEEPAEPAEPAERMQQDRVRIRTEMKRNRPLKTPKSRISQFAWKHLDRTRSVSENIAVKRFREDKRPKHRNVLEEEDATKNYGQRKVFSTGVSDRRAAQRDVEDSKEVLSPAKRLLQQQGCVKFSQVISKSKRRAVMGEERNKALEAAERYAFGLKNANFLVVMRDVQVYHGFQLEIPHEFLQETDTLLVTKMKVCLIDRNHTFYDAKWDVWPGYCRTPLLNSDGWAFFALDHKLEEGDVCVFELVDSHPVFVFLVHIFRVVETSTRESKICDLRDDDQTLLNKSFGTRAGPTEVNEGQKRRQESGKRWPMDDHGRSSLQHTKIQKPNLHLWTKLFKPRMKGHFGGTRGQRQY